MFGAGAQFTFRKGRAHFSLYAKDGERMALIETLAAQMHRLACPHAIARRKWLAAVAIR